MKSKFYGIGLFFVVVFMTGCSKGPSDEVVINDVKYTFKGDDFHKYEVKEVSIEGRTAKDDYVTVTSRAKVTLHLIPFGGTPEDYDELVQVDLTYSKFGGEWRVNRSYRIIESKKNQ